MRPLPPSCSIDTWHGGGVDKIIFIAYSSHKCKGFSRHESPNTTLELAGLVFIQAASVPSSLCPHCTITYWMLFFSHHKVLVPSLNYRNLSEFTLRVSDPTFPLCIPSNIIIQCKKKKFLLTLFFAIQCKFTI